MLLLHILAGSLGLLSGLIAFCAAKGGALHRRSGAAFVVSMLVMAASGAGLAALKPQWVVVVAGLLTIYLLLSAWLTVRRPVSQARGQFLALMLMGLAVGLLSMGLGVEGLYNATGRAGSYPPAVPFAFGTVALGAALLDARLLLTANLSAAHRLARHLWRMGFCTYMAYSSFFLGQAHLFPLPLRRSGLLALPVLLMVLATAYWLWRVLRRRQRACAFPSTARP